MGTYRAQRDTSSGEGEKTQDQINAENNANNIMAAAEVASKTANPYAKAAGYAVKGLDKLTGGKSTQALGSAMNKINKTAPGGKQIQNLSNKASESGASDAVRKGAAMKGGGAGGKGPQISSAANKAGSSAGKQGTNSPSKKSPSSNNDAGSSDSIGENNDGNKKSKEQGKSKIASFLNDKDSGSLLSKLPKPIKIKLLIGAAAVFLFMIICIGVFASDDIKNLSLTNGSGMTSKDGDRNCTPDEIENRLIYVGDSRITGMKSSLSNDSIQYIDKVGMGYNWLKNEAMSTLESKLQENSSYVVVIAFGANDLYNIDNYISLYNSLEEKYSDISFYYMSVNPVDESKESSYGYSLKNSDIEAFNEKLKQAFSDSYIDTYNAIKDDFDTADGLHYNNETNEKIHEYTMSSISDSGEVRCGGGGSGDVLGKLEEVANWYIKNVTTYQQNACGSKGSGARKYYETPFGTRKFGDDCTEFTGAYMSYVAGVDLPESYSGGMIDPNGSYAKAVGAHDWKAYSADSIDSLQPGDVLVAHSGSNNSTKGQHAEVYVDESHSFGWGSCKKSYPTDKTITKSTRNGHVHYEDSGHDYTTIYRYEGATSDSSSSQSSSNSDSSKDTSNINITKMLDSSFNHGTKARSNQKYIMLHDTEMSSDAKSVYQSWKNSGNGVAAHFVVDRDGTIIQTVDLDTISHHAGWGGPGNYDSKFGVGNNDGKGNGDDLVKTQKLSGYTSYGMNSYSVGIEMCHVNGESYPEAQLKSLDSLIAYIDSYFGFKSKIIDHKEWRPSNSDTDTNFSTYLNNYKTSRHH